MCALCTSCHTCKIGPLGANQLGNGRAGGWGLENCALALSKFFTFSNFSYLLLHRVPTPCELLLLMVQTRFAAEAGDFRPIAPSDLPNGFLAGQGLTTVSYVAATVNAVWGEYEVLNPGVTTVNLGSGSANTGAMLGLYNNSGGGINVTVTSGAIFFTPVIYNAGSFTLWNQQSLLIYNSGQGAFFVLAATATYPQFAAANGPDSGTYTTPIGALYLDVEIVGGGGGGAGSGTGATAGGNGGNSTFGGMIAVGGTGGAPIGAGGSGGGVGGGTWINSTGGAGGGSELSAAASVNSPGGHGGASFYGGGGGTTASGSNGQNGQAYGSGGGGGAEATSNAWSAAGGGAGGYVRSIITNPNPTYAWTAGGNGAPGAAGTGGFAGGGGQIGLMRVIAYFQ